MLRFRPSYNILLMLLSLFLFEGQEVNAQILTDKTFIQALDLNYPGLEQVKDKVSKGNYTAAKKAFVAHLKTRTSPQWFTDWRDKDKKRNALWVDINEANRYANNELLSCGTWYKFGKNIDWASNHSGNNYDEWTWQLNRLSHWTVLGKAYWTTGDEKYTRAFVQQLNSWIDQCKKPVKSFNGVGSTWRTIDSGIRVLGNWPNAFYYFLSSPSFDDESIFKMVKSFYEHGCHLREHNTANNWLSIEMQGLYTIAVLFPEFKASSNWREYAISRLYEEELNQFYPDGAQKELAPSYHSVSLSSIVGVYKLSKLNNLTLPKEFVNRLESVYEYYVKVMMPNGQMPAVNDSRWIEAEPYLKEAVELFPERSDFRYVLSHGKEGKRPSYTSVWMPWAGWYVMRSGWGEDDYYAFFEVGPFGTAHQHEDKLNVLLYAYGQPLITECGIYAYDNSEFRKYSLSSRGHNVASVDGNEQNRHALIDKDEIQYSKAPLKNIWKTNRKYDYGEGVYDEGYGDGLDKSVSHKRSVKFIKNKNHKYWIIKDVFTPNDDHIHHYETWFHLSTNECVNDEGNGIVYSKSPNEPNVVIIPLKNNDGLRINVVKGQDNHKIQGYVSQVRKDDSFQRIPVATPYFCVDNQGETYQYYVLIPYGENEVMPVRAIKELSSRKYKIMLRDGSNITVKMDYPF